MFTTQLDDHDFAIKPMNCPGHIQLYNQGLKSYRDLPLRIAEFGVVHRNEPSGTLHGLMRARRFTQDDAHVFCTDDQLQAEVATLIDMVFETYRDFGFTDIALALSLRPDKRVGSDALWDKGEAALGQGAAGQGAGVPHPAGGGRLLWPQDRVHAARQHRPRLAVRDHPGGFLHARPARGALHRRGQQQTDPGDDPSRHPGLHGALHRYPDRALRGGLPAWLAPVQAVVCNITDRQAPYVREVTNALRKKGFRAEYDLRNEKIGFKIREHTLQKVPYLLVLGDREVENRTLAVRDRKGQDLGVMGLDDFMTRLGQEVEART